VRYIEVFLQPIIQALIECDYLRLRGFRGARVGEDARKAAHWVQGHRLRDCLAGEKGPGGSTLAGESVSLCAGILTVYHEGRDQYGKENSYAGPAPRARNHCAL
jgi:hypothetical protein